MTVCSLIQYEIYIRGVFAPKNLGVDFFWREGSQSKKLWARNYLTLSLDIHTDIELLCIIRARQI